MVSSITTTSLSLINYSISPAIEFGGSMSSSMFFLSIVGIGVLMIAGIFTNPLLRKAKAGDNLLLNNVPKSSAGSYQSNSDQSVAIETTFVKTVFNKSKVEIPDEEYKFLSHDMRSPVKRINSLIDMMITHPDESHRLEYISHIQTEVNGLQNLLGSFNNLLYAENPTDSEVSKFNIYAFISPIYSGYQKIGQEKNINIAMDICPSHIVVETHRMVLYRIVDNLINNAVKFTKPGGVVNVTIRTIDNDLILSVSDEGPGVPKEEVDTIFEKFQTGTARPTGDETSSGIGLYLVKTLCEQLDAFVKVESKKKKGATFTMTIPNIVRKF